MEEIIQLDENINDEIETLEEDDFFSYKVVLENFEGPLDLLLSIIKANKMDIETVRLADVTDQYLQYIKQLEMFDMENASEFIEIAAQLIEIKSRTLLPAEKDEDCDEDDSENNLLQRLKELKLFKEASEKLADTEDLDKLYKAPDKMAGNVKVVLKDMVLESMLDAFAMMMATSKKAIIEDQPKQISVNRFTVKDRIFTIRNIIKEQKLLKFTDMFDADLTKNELITTFLALLELLKMQFVKAVQGMIFGEIEIIANEEKINEEITIDETID